MNRRQFWSGKGFYAALALLVAGAATASFLAINSMMSRLSAADSASAPSAAQIGTQDAKGETEPWTQSGAAADTKQQDVPKTAQTPSSAQSASSAAPASSSAPASSPAAQSASSASAAPAASPQQPWAAPLNGEILQGFSGDNLVYNATLRDWRTHNGVDIAGHKNAGVHAPADGTVTDVVEDDGVWGAVIEVTCADGRAVRLCGVTEPKVKTGDAVRRGQTLALLGEVPCESSLGDHLHVEVLTEDAYTDPQALFGQAG